MGLETGLGEALRTDYFLLSEEFTPASMKPKGEVALS